MVGHSQRQSFLNATQLSKILRDEDHFKIEMGSVGRAYSLENRNRYYKHNSTTDEYKHVWKGTFYCCVYVLSTLFSFAIINPTGRCPTSTTSHHHEQ